jgi:uncharacterized protein
MHSNYLLFGIFLLIALSVLFGSHYFVYYSVVIFFKIANANAKIIFITVLFLLPLCFFVSSFLSHIWENSLTRIFYFVASLWLGILTTLVAALILGWLVVGIIRVFGSIPDTRMIGIIIFILTFVYTGYGIWNAFHPRLKFITVKIKNLPEAWKGKTAIQLSDVHLGHILREGFLEGIIEKANTQNPDIVFITGDLFDGMDGDLSGVARPFGGLKAFQGMYYVTGNHETYLGVEKAFAALKGTGINILDDKMAVVDGMQIVGVSYPERGQSKDIGEIMKNMPGFDPANPSILLYHSPTQMDRAKEEGVSLQLSGHTHKGQIFPLGFITRLIYKGYDYGLFKDGDFTLYTTSGTGVWGPTMRTAATPEIVVIKFE